MDIFSTAFKLILTLLAGFLALRTWVWWGALWQNRGYRFDRFRDHISTTKGKQKLYNVWFFKGIFPRPTFTLRVLMLLFLSGFLSFIIFASLVAYTHLPFWACIIITERLLWLTSYISLLATKALAHKKEKELYARAKNIRNHAPKELIVIALTGSYGKTSTKEILVHLLQDTYGAENVLYTPENENSEIAIARLIINHGYFFKKANKTPRIFVVEMGAYKKGEIAQMCDFVSPHHSILTAIGTQHMALFGSQANIQRAKFEIAQNTSKTVWYNADNKLVKEAFLTLTSQADPKPVSLSDAKKIQALPHKNTFEYNKQEFTLSWGGEFFIMNALLCIRLLEHLKIDLKDIAKSLPEVEPLKRALSTHTTKKGTLVLLDPYAASEHGVLAALSHLGKIPGQKVFVGIPQVELGKARDRVHKDLFLLLKKMKAHVFWIGDDYVPLAKEILKDKFHADNFEDYQALVSTFEKQDGILFESRIPDKYVQALPGLENIKLPTPH